MLKFELQMQWIFEVEEKKYRTMTEVRGAVYLFVFISQWPSVIQNKTQTKLPLKWWFKDFSIVFRLLLRVWDSASVWIVHLFFFSSESFQLFVICEEKYYCNVIIEGVFPLGVCLPNCGQPKSVYPNGKKIKFMCTFDQKPKFNLKLTWEY